MIPDDDELTQLIADHAEINSVVIVCLTVALGLVVLLFAVLL